MQRIFLDKAFTIDEKSICQTDQAEPRFNVQKIIRNTGVEPTQLYSFIV